LGGRGFKLKKKGIEWNKKAISSVIGALLMVNIALAMVVLYFAWAQGI
jgi:hypothetical protein